MQVCQPSDPNSNCGGSGGGGTGNVGIGTVNRISKYIGTTTVGSPDNVVIVNGNVGIGSITPGQALDVQGTVRMKGFQLTTSPTSGYVLTSNSIGVGTWAPTSSGGSGTVSSGTVNQEAVYTGTTTVGSGIITDNGTNVGVNATSPNGKLDVEGPLTSNDVLRVGLNNNPYSMLAVYSPSANFGDGGCAEDVEFDVPDVNHDFFVESCGFMEIRSTDPLYYSQPGGQTYIGDGRAESNNDYLKVDDGASQLTWHSDLGIDATIIDESGQMTTQGEVLSTGFVTSGGTSAQCVRGDGSLGACGGGGSNYWNLGIGNVGINTTTNNVGIGTFAVPRQLTISNTAATSTGIELTDHGTGGRSWSFFSTNNGSSLGGGKFGIFDDGTSKSVLTADSSDNVGINTVIPSAMFEVGNRKLDVLVGGNVGIGTWIPNNILNVKGSVTVNSGGIGLDNTQGIFFTDTSGSNTANILVDSSNRMKISQGIPFGPMQLSTNGADIQFVTLGGTNLDLANNGQSIFGGNVGIGSPAPGQTLDVAGNIRVITGVYAASQASAPTIASNDCGTLTQGTVTSGATDLAGSINAGTAAGSVLSCSVTFGQTHTTSPASCVCNDGSTPLALAATYSTTKVTCTALATVASGTISYQCQWNKP